MRTFKNKSLTLIFVVGLSTIACGMEQSSYNSDKQTINKEFQMPQPLKVSLYVSAGFTITYITYRLGEYVYLKIQESKTITNQRVSTDIVPDIIKG